jgi:hypothetical protein
VAAAADVDVVWMETPLDAGAHLVIHEAFASALQQRGAAELAWDVKVDSRTRRCR